MMIVKTLLDAAGETGAGSAQAMNRAGKVFQYLVTGTATLKLEGSVDGTNWVDLATGLSASGKTANTEPWPFVRANVTGYTSGAVSCWVAEESGRY